MSAKLLVDELQRKAEFHRDVTSGAHMQRYMKDIAPFIGLPTPLRRSLLKAALKQVPLTTHTEVLQAINLLWKLDEREFKYWGYDIAQTFHKGFSAKDLSGDIEEWLTTQSWWDTVDGLGTAVVSPLCLDYAAVRETIEIWLMSDNPWLIRAALQHQRGHGARTDIDRMLHHYEMHVADKRFFVAKALGWGLRDASRWAPQRVSAFVKNHPEMSAVARREALRGLQRSISSS